MFYYSAVCILTIYLPVATLAIECLECDQKLKLNSPELLNTTRTECTKKYQVGDMCLATLSIDFENQTAIAYLSHLPDQSLTFFNGNRMMTSLITIWLSKNLASQSIQSMGIDNAAVVEDINKMYSRTKTLKYEELRTKLREYLYISISHNYNLTCSDNQNQTVACPNGFCQLTGNFTSTIDRKCVSHGNGANPSGILIGSNSMEGSDAIETIAYACNKAMCNGADADKKVRQLLIDYGLFGTKIAPPQSSTMTTPRRFAMTTSQSSEMTTPQSSAMTTSYQTMMNFQWVLLLIMTSLFKI